MKSMEPSRSGRPWQPPRLLQKKGSGGGGGEGRGGEVGASPGPSPPPLHPLPSTGTAGFRGRALRLGTWSGLGAEYSSPSHLELGPHIFSLRHTERLQAEARCRTGKFRGREQVGTAWAVGSGLALSSEICQLCSLPSTLKAAQHHRVTVPGVTWIPLPSFTPNF